MDRSWEALHTGSSHQDILENLGKSWQFCKINFQDYSPEVEHEGLKPGTRSELSRIDPSSLGNSARTVVSCFMKKL